jgi:hypothetical protein
MPSTLSQHRQEDRLSTDMWLAGRIINQGLHTLTRDEVYVAYSSPTFSTAWRALTGHDLPAEVRALLAERVSRQQPRVTHPPQRGANEMLRVLVNVS